jgi:hypothetical protein
MNRFFGGGVEDSDLLKLIFNPRLEKNTSGPLKKISFQLKTGL